MRFQPKTEEEIQTSGLLPEGVYGYEVLTAEEKTSAKGNEYIAIKLLVWDNEGGEHLVFTNMALIKLLKHFCDVNNMQDKYQSGNIPSEDFLHKAGGKVIIKLEGEKPNPNGGTYKAKNIVDDYIAEMPKSTLHKPLNTEFIDSDIPF